MKLLFTSTIVAALFLVSCQQPKTNPIDVAKAKIEIGHILDSIHAAAGTANYDQYFSYYADSAVFIGTDATENWQIDSFKTWAKPFFDRGKAWNFKSLEKHIYFSKTGDVAWFDELLSTQMKICRGSGVFQIENGHWKLKHYVLSMTIPNDNTKVVIDIKSPIEDSLLQIISSK